jgi:hypothetical protein
MIALSFAAKENKNVAESDGNNGANVDNGEKEQILVKIEEDEYAKINKKEKSSQYIGVSYNFKTSKWKACRHRKYEKKIVCNGCYDNEEIAAHAGDTLARKLMANGEQSHKLNFPDDETEIFPEKRTIFSQFIGVTYNVNRSKWQAQRRSKLEKKMICGYYDYEDTAAHASDTLARKLMRNGEQGHKLNFADDVTEVFPEKKTTYSQYIGVSYNFKGSKWEAQRHSKLQKKIIHNGSYDNEKTAAHASDTLARKLMTNGEQGHKLNFPKDGIEVFAEEKLNYSKFIGVTYDVNKSKWLAQRRGKLEKKMCYNGFYDNEETAAHASDTLAKKLKAKGEQGHKLNFPDDDTEVFRKERQRVKRKRPDHEDLDDPKSN